MVCGGVTARLAGEVVEEFEHRCGVLGCEVDLAGVKGLHRQVAEPGEALHLGCVSAVGQSLAVDLGEDGALAEVLGADADGWAVDCFIGAVTRPTGGGQNGQHQGRPNDTLAEAAPHGFLLSVSGTSRWRVAAPP